MSHAARAPASDKSPGQQPVTSERRADAEQQVGGVAPEILRLQSLYGNRAVEQLIRDGRETRPSVVPAGGAPLSADLRQSMEGRIGGDLSDVIVHTGPDASLSASAQGARAYAVGRHVVFGAGWYDPASSHGQQLITHELAHVARSSPAARAETPAGALPRVPAASIDEEAATARARAGRSPIPPSRQSEAREPLAVRREAMTRENIFKRMAELNSVMADPAFSLAERKQAADEMTQLNVVLKGGTPASGPSTVTSVAPKAEKPAPKPAPSAASLTISKTASLDELVEVMRVIDAIKPSGIASGLFATTFKGQEITLTFQQVGQVRAAARKSMTDALGKSRRQAASAVDRYKSQEQVNADFPVTSRAAKAWAWVSTFGDYSNPSESVYGQSMDVNLNATAAELALASGNFAQAMRHVAQADAASERTSKIVHAYINQLIESGEGLVTGLTFTRNAAFITVGVLAVIITGGAALGLEAGVVGSGVGGLTVAQTVTAVSVGAPIVANVGEGITKAAHGDKVDWTEIGLHAARDVVLSKFGGKLGAGIAGKIAGNPASQTLARQAVASVASGTATHVVSQAFTQAVEAFNDKARKGKDVTWGTYYEGLTTSLADPMGWFMVAVSSGVQTGAQAKVSNAVKAQQAAAAKAPPVAAPAATQPAKAAPPPAPAAKSAGETAPATPEPAATATSGGAGPATPAPVAPAKPVTGEPSIAVPSVVAAAKLATVQPATPTTSGPLQAKNVVAASKNKADSRKSYYGGGEGIRKGMKQPPAEPTVEKAPPSRSPRPTLSATPAERTMVSDAQRLAAKTGKPLAVKVKAVADEGTLVRSGFGKRAGGPATTKKVMDTAKEIGHKLSENTSIDEKVPGQSAASHAEKKAAIENPGKALAVDLAMCDDCFAFFQKLAMHRGPQVVHEPGQTWVFRPDGVRVGVSRGAEVIIHPDGSASAVGME